MKSIKYLWVITALLFFSTITVAEETQKEEPFNPTKTIFEHLGDEYGWKIGGSEISLPVIVKDHIGTWHFFSSKHLKEGNVHEGFYIASEGDHANKIESRDEVGNTFRPFDLSITKNVLALFICAIVMCITLFPLVRWYRKNHFKAPRKVLGMMEVIILMLYDEVIVGVLGKDAKRFAPYLLTLFFFIFFSNLLGMIVVFPGGANVMGNLAITMVLALCTFVVVNVSGTKEYWKETLWPDVPLWLKFPIPMMPIIEIFGIFTKPMALMIRLFANMLGGHLITLVLISLIFLFGTMGAAVQGTTTVVSVAFAVFMNVIDLLICFIQAYVFMMLSTIFISLARVKHEG